jgi:prolyl 4-hydroxylase
MDVETIVAPTITDADRHTAAFQPLLPTFPGLRLATPPGSSPPVFVVDNFLTPEECTSLMTAGASGLKRSIVVDGLAGKSAAPSRTSESCYLLKESTLWLSARIATLLGKPVSTQEPAQVARYKEGQYYLGHFDAFDVTTGPGRECVATGGQRVATVLVYLNDVAAGGGTFFPRLGPTGTRFMPSCGRAVVFFPCALDGRLDPLALHAAEAAVDEKWVAQVWVRKRDFC